MNKSQYEAILKICSDKINGDIDLDWKEIIDKFGLKIHYDTLRKASQTIFGGAFVKEYFEDKGFVTNESSLDLKLQALRKERMKLQTTNIERSRLDRKEARQELYYEQVKNAIQMLPVPAFKNEIDTIGNRPLTYVVVISDTHYGATFESHNNSYSPEEFGKRLEYLSDRLIEFITSRGLQKIIVTSLGDSIQGIIHMSDLALNDTSVVKAVVNYSRLIAMFLNKLSAYTNIAYYHVPTANHTQIRPLGTKASELADEDLEYVIGNYIKDILENNPRVNVHLANDNTQYIKIADVTGFDLYALHGHQIKNISTALQDIRTLTNQNVDFLLMGHLHGGKETIVAEGCTYDCEVIVAPSFIGSDPYSDSLFKGSKGAVKIYGFDDIYGHTETYKIILN